MKCKGHFIIALIAGIVAHSCLTAQMPDVLPSENLVVDGITPIPRAIVEGVGRYTEFRFAGFSSWHPTKKEMVVVTRFGDTPQLHYVTMPGGARTQLTFFADRVGGATFGPTRGDYFIFSKDIGGGEWYQLYRYDVATGATTLLTDGSSRNLFGYWSPLGDRCAYLSTRRTGKDLDLYLIDPMNPASDTLVAELAGGGWEVLDWSPDGTTILLMESISINESYLWLYNVKTTQRMLLTPKSDTLTVSRGNAVFSRDGKGLYLTTDEDSEFLQLCYMDLASHMVTPLLRDSRWDVSAFDLSPDGRKIAFVTNENGFSVLRVLDIKAKKEVKIPPMPKGIVSGLSWHPNGTMLALTLSSARASADVYVVDPKAGTLTRWTYSETGGINPETFAVPELITWKTFDGITLSGILYKPPARFTGKRPVIINIHGGPESQARPGFIGRNNYYLSELGVAMIYPNVRGSSGFGKSFLKLDNGFDRQGSYKDIGTLLEYVATRPDLDADRIMITGGSYGGHMTFAVASLYSDRIRCALPVVGMSSLVTFLEHTEGYRRDLRRVEYGDERDPKMREFLNSIAPLNNAEKIRKPLFVVQGKNDPRVPYTESEQMVQTLKKNNVPVWYLLATDEGHGFSKKSNQDYQMYATVMFINAYLLN